GATDTDLMRLRDGWIAKGGAEGLFCAAHEDGRGIALKAEDGAYRAIRAALGQVLGIDEFLDTPVRNSRGEAVGSITRARSRSWGVGVGARPERTVLCTGSEGRVPTPTSAFRGARLRRAGAKGGQGREGLHRERHGGCCRHRQVAAGDGRAPDVRRGASAL